MYLGEASYHCIVALSRFYKCVFFQTFLEELKLSPVSFEEFVFLIIFPVEHVCCRLGGFTGKGGWTF